VAVEYRTKQDDFLSHRLARFLEAEGFDISQASHIAITSEAYGVTDVQITYRVMGEKERKQVFTPDELRAAIMGKKKPTRPTDFHPQSPDGGSIETPVQPKVVNVINGIEVTQENVLRGLDELKQAIQDTPTKGR
jgi:hypothetical protein